MDTIFSQLLMVHFAGIVYMYHIMTTNKYGWAERFMFGLQPWGESWGNVFWVSAVCSGPATFLMFMHSYGFDDE